MNLFNKIFQQKSPVDKPGYLDGKYHADYVKTVEELESGERYAEAENLLLRLIDVIESEAKANNDGVAPWAYEELAIVLRKENRINDEIAILERYFRQKQAPGASPARLAKRLERAKELAK